MKRLVDRLLLDALVRCRAGRAEPLARLLRLLRRQGGHEALQQGLAGRARARRRPHRADDGERLQGRSEGVRGRHPGADGAAEGPDPRRRQGAARPPRRLFGAAAGRVLRRGPVRRRRRLRQMVAACAGAPRRDAASRTRARARSLGVTIEAQYTVGEYDILILSAQQSGGLETWLRENGYRIPARRRRRCWAATSSRT